MAQPFNQRGLSLIELMIAMVLGLLLTLGATQIFLSGNQTYRQTHGLAYAQESARFVSAILKPDIRSAGSFGCLAEMGRPLNQVVDNRLNAGPVIPAAQAVQGWEFNNTGPGDNITLAAAMATPAAGNWRSGTAGTALPADLAGSVVTNSDVFIVNALNTIGVPLNAANPQNGNSLNLTDSTGLPAGRVILATAEDCSQGEIFQKSNNANATSITMAGANVNPGNNGNTYNLSYGPQSRVYEFTSTAFYIGQGTNGEPALFRRLLTPLQPPQELVSGVETLQVLYGIDTGGTAAADNYLPADQVADWNEVVSLRFAAMTRSQEEVLDNPNGRAFDMLGSQVAQGNNADRRARITSVGTTALRTRM